MTADLTRRPTRRTIRQRLLLVLAVLALLASACGGSSDGDTALPGDPGGAGDGTVDLDGIDIEIPDVNLDDLDGDGQNDEEQAAESPYTGFRFWSETRVEELLPGGPDNLGPNPFDESSFDGPSFEYEPGPGRTSDDRYVSTMVASYDWAWVVSGRDGEQVIRLDYESNSVNVTVDTEALLAGGSTVALVGDEDAIYVGIDSPTEKVVVELDPTTGEERGRVDLPSVATPLLLLDINASHLAVGYRDGVGPVVVIDRSSREIAFEIVDPDNALAVPLLTNDELLIVHKTGRGSEGDTVTAHSLSDGAETAETILPGNASTRAFGNTVVQFDAAASEPELYGIAGHGQVIVDALNAAAALVPDEPGIREIGDIYIGDGFAIVQGCCIDVDFSDNRSIFVIDLGSGEIVLTSKANGTIVAPPG